jgi:hypothetical protein
VNKKYDIDDEIASSSRVVQEYITRLTEENEKIIIQLVKKDVKILRLTNTIKALEREIKENKPEFSLVMNLGNANENA